MVPEKKKKSFEELNRENKKLREQADKQNREFQIEAALERVRSRTMAMHSSDELREVVSVAFNELAYFGIDVHLCILIIYDWKTKEMEWWLSGLGIDVLPQSNQIPINEEIENHPLVKRYFRAQKEGIKFGIYQHEGELKRIWDQYLWEHTDLRELPDELKEAMMSYEHVLLSDAFMSCGTLEIAGIETLSDEKKHILQRFARVIDQSYSRFLDLQKAEEQAREARIEASLERVRARTMGMHNSDELREVVNELFEQMNPFGLGEWGFQVRIAKEDGSGFYAWLSTPDQRVLPERYDIPTLDHWALKKYWTIYEQQIPFNTIEVSGKDKLKMDQLLFKESDLKMLPDDVKQGILDANYVLFSVASMKYGLLEAIDVEPKGDEEVDILKRFTKVFEQTYTRFLDLQKAEEQVREAQIEAALERIRSRSMGMQKSEEINEVLAKMFDEFTSLQVDLERIILWIYHPEDRSVTIWAANPEARSGADSFHISDNDNLVYNDYWRLWEERRSKYYYELSGEVKKSWDDYIFSNTELRHFPKEVKMAMREPDPIHLYNSFQDFGVFFVASVEYLDEAVLSLIERFAKVFQQAWTRFNDIKQAEEQAREAKIEASLERIRSRSMAMQSSDELSEVVRVMYDEVEKLEVSNWGCLLMIFDEENQNIQTWFSEIVNKLHAKRYNFPNQNHEVVRKWWEFWKSDKKRMSILQVGEVKHEFAHYLFRETGFRDLPDEVKDTMMGEEEVYFEYVNMKHGLVQFIDIEPFPEDSIPVLQRITRTFEQAYTRFLDVQRAEKLALETARQSSLDRIRAEIASMRSAEDLNQITPLIWDELKTLEIPFIRCGVFIIDEENGISHTYLSTSQGDPIAALHLPLQGISLVQNARTSWKKEEIYTEHWNEQDFREWSQTLIDGGYIESKKKYSAGSVPETLDLHFLPFKHGMLYIGNTKPLSQGELDLGQSMANAFSVAYDRYEDFNKLEQAKQKIEEAFQELEAAKDQLVQQEKLASLGQLTAGIAHEIKNPLNFVNNFSDLSIELVDEVRDEVKLMTEDGRSNISPLEGSAEVKRRRGVSDEATNYDLILDILDILDDIETNLQTIHKHGTRADGIVKSMLQHSRGGDGKMEPTPLNPLIKEYVNLAFHGMRAGKQPINVDIELDLDKNIGEVDMITEDFSRVILNLCNNAFDAMREKLSENAKGPDGSGLQNIGRKSEKPLSPNPSPVGEGRRGEGEYSPKLTIRTHKNNQTVSIEIQDNGPGIPEEIKDKILQPFFTTKKGTAGTGLGLSITHDIIKAHGGSLDIETDEQGTTFSIILNS